MACTAVGQFGAGSVTGSLGLAGSLEGLEPAGGTPSFAAGRVSRVVPAMLGEISARTHFHLVGNGQFVAEMQQGLLGGGVDEGRVTTEKYFNGKATADEDVVAFVADAVRARLPQAA